MSLLEQNTIRKEQVDENNIIELDAGKNSKKYKIEVIWDSKLCAKKSAGHLSEVYYPVF